MSEGRQITFAFYKKKYIYKRFVLVILGRRMRFCIFFSFFFFFFCLFLGLHRSIWRFPGWGSSRSCNHQPMPQPQQHGIRAASATYTIAHRNARSLTHWVRPGIKPSSSWMLVGFYVDHNLRSKALATHYFHECDTLLNPSEGVNH